MEVLKVSMKTNVSSLAGAIANILREGKTPELHCIGAGAVNQANKAMATARGYVAAEGKDLVFTVAFHEVEFEDGIKTSLVMRVETRD